MDLAINFARSGFQNGNAEILFIAKFWRADAQVTEFVRSVSSRRCSFSACTARMCTQTPGLPSFGSGEFQGQVKVPTEGLEILCDGHRYKFACPFSSGERIIPCIS